MTTNVQNLNKPKIKICSSCLLQLQKKIKEGCFDFFLYPNDECIAFIKALDFILDEASVIADINYVKSCILCELESSQLIYTNDWINMTSRITCETLAGNITFNNQVEIGSC